MFAGHSIRNFDDPGMDGDTPLHFAAYSGFAEDVEVMADIIQSVNLKGGIGNTPLHLAVLGGHPDVVDILLRHGACIDAKNDYGDVPMDFLNINASDVLAVVRKNTSVEKP